ncbi:MAG: citrate synthase/methylcitrate synthase [Actinomycetia bacterium]|nr:citrate synthase/methylcitrate synthase [Actinomycetes bacterium]
MTSSTTSPATEPLTAPPGLKGVIVADTAVGAVRGADGFFHYRQHDAAALARSRSLEAVIGVVLDNGDPGSDPAPLRRRLGTLREIDSAVGATVDLLAGAGHTPMAVLRAVMGVAIDPRPSLDLSSDERRAAVEQAIGLTPTVLARAHRVAAGLTPIGPDPELGHAADWVRMATGVRADGWDQRAIETYLALTVDHGFNASTFTARVVTSTGADVGGALSSALAALSGPLHGGAPSRVLDMLEAIGDPRNTTEWATRELEAGRKLMGFGHAVYRADDPRSEVLRDLAREHGTDLADRAEAIEARLLDLLRSRRPGATIVSNVEFWAAVTLHLAGLPQELFTPSFAVSRVIGWSAHLLEQAEVGKIFRPASRYVGEEPDRAGLSTSA